MSSIHEKLLKFQKEHIILEKDGTNPHFKSSYVTLNEVLKSVKKPLYDLGVLILQIPTLTGLETHLIDIESGSEVVSTMPYVDTTTPQKLGSCNTYNRRYSLITMLGLEDEDDDAEVASKSSNKIIKDDNFEI